MKQMRQPFLSDTDQFHIALRDPGGETFELEIYCIHGLEQHGDLTRILLRNGCVCMAQETPDCIMEILNERWTR